MMGRWFCCLAVVAVVTGGCANSMLLERHTALKADLFSRTSDYSSSDFEVLGPIEATGSSRVVLGVVQSGSEGYGLLMNAARQKYGESASSVMFIFSEYRYKGILYPLFGRIQTSYSGTAVRVKTVSHTPAVRIKE